MLKLSRPGLNLSKTCLFVVERFRCEINVSGMPVSKIWMRVGNHSGINDISPWPQPYLYSLFFSLIALKLFSIYIILLQHKELIKGFHLIYKSQILAKNITYSHMVVTPGDQVVIVNVTWWPSRKTANWLSQHYHTFQATHCYLSVSSAEACRVISHLGVYGAPWQTESPLWRFISASAECICLDREPCLQARVTGSPLINGTRCVASIVIKYV